MNERIRKLAEQAVREVDNVDLDSPLQEELSKMYIPDCFSEKFAELIVEECRYVMDCNKGSDQNPEWNRALSETSKKVKEHFGVE